MSPRDLVNTTPGKPARGVDHAKGQSSNPLEVDKARHVPLLVDKDVACVEVGDLKSEGPVAAVPIEEMVCHGSHQSADGHQSTAVLLAEGAVRILEEASVMEREHVCYERLGTRIGFVSWDYPRRTVVLVDHETAGHRSVRQCDSTVVVELERSDPRLRDAAERENDARKTVE